MVSRASQDTIFSDRDYWNNHTFPAHWTVDISHDASASLNNANIASTVPLTRRRQHKSHCFAQHEFSSTGDIRPAPG
jgi:hypothetical protein